MLFSTIQKVLALSLFSSLALASDAPLAPDPTFAARVVSTNKVGLEFIREAIKIDAKNSQAYRNMLVSPISAYTTFSMLRDGLRLASKAKLEFYLQAPGATIADFDSQNALLLKALRIPRLPEAEQPKTGPKPPVLGIANSAWANNGQTDRQKFEFTPTFASAIQTHYAATVQSVDFSANKGADAINAWANKMTNGLIPRIIERATLKDLQWLLLNATYLEANWADKFTALPAAQAARFSLLDGRKIAVDMISGRAEWNSYEKTDYQVVEIPLHGDQISFIVIVPKTLQDFKTWMSRDNFFVMENWNEISRELAQAASAPHDQIISLKMPKFAFGYSRALAKADGLTTDLGLEFLFDPENRYDFHPLGGIVGAEPGSVVSLIKHDTRIAVDENGIKAAAVTSVGGGATSARPAKPIKEIVVDKPFVFAIASKPTGALLFIGTVVDPKAH